MCKDRGLCIIGINIEEDSDSLEQRVQSQGATMDYAVRAPHQRALTVALRHACTLLSARMQHRLPWALQGSS